MGFLNYGKHEKTIKTAATKSDNKTKKEKYYLEKQEYFTRTWSNGITRTKNTSKNRRTLGKSNEQKHKRLAKYGQKINRNKQGTSNKTSEETTASSNAIIYKAVLPGAPSA